MWCEPSPTLAPWVSAASCPCLVIILCTWIMVCLSTIYTLTLHLASQSSSRSATAILGLRTSEDPRPRHGAAASQIRRTAEQRDVGGRPAAQLGVCIAHPGPLSPGPACMYMYHQAPAALCGQGLPLRPVSCV